MGLIRAREKAIHRGVRHEAVVRRIGRRVHKRFRSWSQQRFGKSRFLKPSLYGGMMRITEPMLPGLNSHSLMCIAWALNRVQMRDKEFLSRYSMEVASRMDEIRPTDLIKICNALANLDGYNSFLKEKLAEKMVDKLETLYAQDFRNALNLVSMMHLYDEKTQVYILSRFSRIFICARPQHLQQAYCSAVATKVLFQRTWAQLDKAVKAFYTRLRSEYDRGVNTFSPEGRLFQVEYALGAMKLGSTAIAVATRDGVIFASERRASSPLLEFVSLEKIMEIDAHIACAMSGLIADAKTLVDHARSECVNHTFVYNERMGIRSCVEAIADLALEFSDVFDSKKKKTMSRPFGVALLVGGVDSEGPVIWCVDPSGTMIKYKAAAIGSAQEGAESMLLQKFDENMEFADAELLVLDILRQVMEDKMTPKNVEMARIRADDVAYREYDEETLQGLISRLPELQENVDLD